jgi:TetR/AcrR family transcriptional regulator
MTEPSKASENKADPSKRRKRDKPAWGENVLSTEEQRGTREQILFETAARFFRKYGFHGTSMSQLTEELGLTKGALYYYVKDKSDLLYKLHLKFIEATRRTNERAKADGQNGYERVRRMVLYYVAAVTASPTETFILLEEGALKPEQAAEVVELRRKLQRDLRDQIQSGIDDGSIVPCDTRLAALALVGAMAWVTNW